MFNSRLVHYSLRCLLLFLPLVLLASGLYLFRQEWFEQVRPFFVWLSFPLLPGIAVLAFFWQSWHEKRFLTRSRDVQRAFSHLVCLAEIPPLYSPTAKPLLLTNEDDFRAVEAFQTLYASVRLAFTFSNQQYLFVTSADRHEGKSVVAINLGQSCAEVGRRVLLVEGHWDAPALHRYFDLPGRGNLGNLLKQVSEMVDLRSEARALARLTEARPQLVEWLNRSLQKSTTQPNLFVLTNGVEPIPLELRQPVLFRGIMEAALAQFDMVICDGPPMLSKNGSWRSLAVLGEVLLVVAAYHTRHQELYTVLETLRLHPISPIGVVLNHPQANATYPQAITLLHKPSVLPSLPPTPVMRPVSPAEASPSPLTPQPQILPLAEKLPVPKPHNGKHKPVTPPITPMYKANGNGHAAASLLVAEKEETQENAAAIQERLNQLEKELQNKETLLAQKESEIEQIFQAQVLQNDLFDRLRQELTTQRQENQQLQALNHQHNEDLFLLEKNARERIYELEQKLAQLQTRFQQASVTLYRRWQENNSQ